MPPSLTIIVATDRQRGIGLNNRLPWHLPEDLAHFKRTTSGHPILMGRKTFDSIGRPLPNRRNIVITRNTEWQHEGVEIANSLEAAAQLTGNQETFIIGGAQIYSAALPYVKRMIVTEIGKIFGCDTFFPEFNLQQWQEISRKRYHSQQHECDYDIATYERIT